MLEAEMVKPRLFLRIGPVHALHPVTLLNPVDLGYR
jgi:hypothetical protein